MARAEKIYEIALKELFKRVGLKYPNKKFTAKDGWYNKRAWTEEEYQDFNKWMVKLLMKRMGMLKKKAEFEAGMFLLNYSWATPKDNGCLYVLGKEKKL